MEPKKIEEYVNTNFDKVFIPGLMGKIIYQNNYNKL